MRTVRNRSRLLGGCTWSWGVYLPGGWTWSGGCTYSGGYLVRGVYLAGGWGVPGPGSFADGKNPSSDLWPVKFFIWCCEGEDLYSVNFAKFPRGEGAKYVP